MITLEQFKAQHNVKSLGFYKSKVEGSNRLVGSITQPDGSVVKYITGKTFDSSQPVFVTTVMVPDIDPDTGEELDREVPLNVLCNARAFDMEL